ncbi:hypothetical protein [Glaciibacter flavus]|uniref:hypothetical protein n=1 Tax=Orlajensenia flava TaxID=2565934 RepID=UPI003AFFC87E
MAVSRHHTPVTENISFVLDGKPLAFDQVGDLLHKKRVSDLEYRQTAEHPRGQRDPGTRRECRMAAGENESQSVVADAPNDSAGISPYDRFGSW